MAHESRSSPARTSPSSAFFVRLNVPRATRALRLRQPQPMPVHDNHASPDARRHRTWRSGQTRPVVSTRARSSIRPWGRISQTQDGVRVERLPCRAWNKQRVAGTRRRRPRFPRSEHRRQIMRAARRSEEHTEENKSSKRSWQHRRAPGESVRRRRKVGMQAGLCTEQRRRRVESRIR